MGERTIGREPESFDVWCPDDGCADASSFRSRMVETRPGFWSCPECGATANDSELEDPVAPLPQRMSSGWTVTDEMLEVYRTGPPVGGGLSWNESKRASLQAVLDLAAPPAAKIPTVTDAPIPMRLTCPSCGELHIDVGEFATKPHHTHACQHCGMVWRPAVVKTVGVRFLPGYRNEEATQ